MTPPDRLEVRQTGSTHLAAGYGLAAGHGPAADCCAYHYAPELPKPCLHPLVTPRGHILTGFQMSDHIWHRGLWFAIKLVNGHNLWEENPPFGVQRSAAEPRGEFLAADTLRLTHDLLWTAPAGEVLLREHRTMRWRIPATGVRAIDWSSVLDAADDLTLDRTPYTTWGGYGGLSFRASRQLHEARFRAPGAEPGTSLAGGRHPWVAMDGRMDGGVDERIALAILDHPANPRSPSPWYCKTGNGSVFMNAAFLFHEPLALARGERMSLRYRVLWRDGTWTDAELADLAADFAAEEVGA